MNILFGIILDGGAACNKQLPSFVTAYSDNTADSFLLQSGHPHTEFLITDDVSAILYANAGLFLKPMMATWDTNSENQKEVLETPTSQPVDSVMTEMPEV